MLTSGCHCVRGEVKEGVDVVAMGFSSNPSGPAVVRFRQWGTDIGTHGEVWYHEVSSVWATIDPSAVPSADELQMTSSPELDERHYMQPYYHCDEPVELDIMGAGQSLALHGWPESWQRSHSNASARASTATGYIETGISRGQNQLWLQTQPENTGQELTAQLADALGVEALPTFGDRIALANTPDMKQVVGVAKLLEREEPERDRFLHFRLAPRPDATVEVLSAHIFEGPTLDGEVELAAREDGASALGILQQHSPKEEVGLELWELSKTGTATPITAESGMISASLEVFSVAGRWGWGTDREVVLLGEGATPEVRRNLDKSIQRRAFRAMPAIDGEGLWMLTSKEVTEREPWRGWCNGGIKGIYGVEVCLEQLATDLSTTHRQCETISGSDLDFPDATKSQRRIPNYTCQDRY